MSYLSESFSVSLKYVIYYIITLLYMLAVLTEQNYIYLKLKWFVSNTFKLFLWCVTTSFRSKSTCKKRINYIEATFPLDLFFSCRGLTVFYYFFSVFLQMSFTSKMTAQAAGQEHTTQTRLPSCSLSSLSVLTSIVLLHDSCRFTEFSSWWMRAQGAFLFQFDFYFF